jgi:thiol-disulfide isomerase/thioredoxin
MGRHGWLVWLVALAMLGGRGEAREETEPRLTVAGRVVDEAGKPVAGVSVSAKSWVPVESATSGEDGTFQLRLPINSSSRVYAALVSQAGDGRLGLKEVSFEAAKPEVVTITVKPARPLEVRVVDGAGQPVAGAEIHALADFQQVASGQTDDRGIWAACMPADLATAWRVYALKPRVGFDYAQADRARGSAEPPLAIPETLTLTLDGARPPLRVKAVDRDGKPLAGIEVGPWLLRKPGHEREMNGMSDAFRKTDAAGVATFDWLPGRLDETASIVAHTTNYYTPDYATGLPADKPVDELTLTFLPFERLSGRVTTADGRPAAGATVRLEGQGAGHNSFHGEVTTGPDGRYALRVHSEQAYIVTASKGEMAAPYLSGIVVRAGKPDEGVDLVIGPATRLKGRVTVGKDRKPVAKVNVAAVIEKGSIPAELKKEGDRIYRQMSLWTWTQTDTDGRYEFLFGPGEYRIHGPPQVEEGKLTVPADNPPHEVVRDFAMPRPERGRFTITVADEAGKPVAKAVVDGAYQAQTAYFTRVTADAHGTVHLERSLDPLILVAATPDRSRAGSVHVDAEATEAKVVVKPTATATGRLVDPQGKPIPGLKLSYGVRVHLGLDRNSPFSWHFGGAVTTDPAGNFRLVGLLPGETYEMYWYNEATGRIPSARTQVKPADPSLLALGDVTIDLSPPKPYVPPTPAQRTSEAFAARKEKTPHEKLEYTLVEAKREYTRPLLLFGNPKDPVCIALFRLFNESTGEEGAKVKTPADLRWVFELASLDTGQADVQALEKDLGVTPASGDPPCLTVLSDDGKLAATYPLRPGADGKLDARPLAAFLLANKLPTRDAEAMLSEALAQAKASDRRVFLIMSASWCGPCRMLARFLTANKAELNRHYVFVKLDISRDAHAQELLVRYEGKDARNGVPWYVILDASGKPLITSNAKEAEEWGSTNIGFPSTKSGIVHFVAMLRQTAPRLSDEALATLRGGSRRRHDRQGWAS